MSTLIRVDKNGTKYYEDHVCPKCGGSGYIDYYHYVDGGVCFLCGGSGTHTTGWKEYTPEYAAKLAERRKARAIKKAPEMNRKFFEKHGFDEAGNTYIVKGNTYTIKDELKANGAKFNDLFGWHFDHEDNGYDCFVVNIKEIGHLTETHAWDFNDWFEVELYIKNKRNSFLPKSNSEYIAEVGDKVEIKATLKAVFTYETHYSYYGEINYIYKFVDAEGNVIVWKTSWKDIKEGQEYVLKGKVKDLNEYKGEKQTILTRCKIA